LLQNTPYNPQFGKKIQTGGRLLNSLGNLSRSASWGQSRQSGINCMKQNIQYNNNLFKMSAPQYFLCPYPPRAGSNWRVAHSPSSLLPVSIILMINEHALQI